MTVADYIRLAKLAQLPLVVSQYLDTDEWGVLGDNNQIVVPLSAKFTQAECQQVVDAANSRGEA